MDIAGISFSPDSKSIYVALNNAIVEYDIDLVARRSFPWGDLR